MEGGPWKVAHGRWSMEGGPRNSPLTGGQCFPVLIEVKPVYQTMLIKKVNLCCLTLSSLGYRTLDI